MRPVNEVVAYYRTPGYPMQVFSSHIQQKYDKQVCLIDKHS
ncbi:hypothetical protein [Nitrosomonas europaea]|nr:hypothetical protein [Nitrosomonas europaea]MEB2330866.1 hypothetical protein [Nitrosomonas sp.]HRO56228.1 hypothetical protein [Nitrosomonas europaea]HRQ08526.1 hypothetical protein [Nitrosomonas europaea]HUM73760.1 hypothetical protein [Nitrosomonas europaea]